MNKDKILLLMKEDQKKRISEFLNLIIGIVLALSLSLCVEGYIESLKEPRVINPNWLILLGLVGTGISIFLYIFLIYSRTGYLITFPISSIGSVISIRNSLRRLLEHKFKDFRIKLGKKELIFLWKLSSFFVIPIKITQTNIQILFQDDRSTINQFVKISDSLKEMKTIKVKYRKMNSPEILYFWNFFGYGAFTLLWPMFLIILIMLPFIAISMIIAMTILIH